SAITVRVAPVSARVAALAKGAFPAAGMLTRLTIAVVLLAVGAAGAGLFLQRTATQPPESGQRGGASEKPAEGRKQAPQTQEEPLPPGALARMGSVRFCPGSTVQSVAFSPDRRTLASGNNDGTVSLWEVTTGREVRRLRPGQTPVMSVSFSPDG